MVDYKKILQLSSEGNSLRQVAARVGNSHHTVKDVLDVASEHNISWPLDDEITNEELELLLYPERKNACIAYAEPDYAYIHRELSKKGVTLSLLWSEYCERCYANGKKPYMSTQFGDKYRSWARVTKATMRINHKPGETMQVDWAGGTIPYYDSVTAEEYKAYLFVAVLPYK